MLDLEDIIRITAITACVIALVLLGAWIGGPGLDWLLR